MKIHFIKVYLELKREEITKLESADNAGKSRNLL